MSDIALVSTTAHFLALTTEIAIIPASEDPTQPVNLALHNQPARRATMSTRFPSRMSSISEDIHFAAPHRIDTRDRKITKFDPLDAVFLGMIVISVGGLTYEWLR